MKLLRLLLICVLAVGFAGAPLGCSREEQAQQKPPQVEKKEAPKGETPAPETKKEEAKKASKESTTK